MLQSTNAGDECHHSRHWIAPKDTWREANLRNLRKSQENMLELLDFLATSRYQKSVLKSRKSHPETKGAPILLGMLMQLLSMFGWSFPDFVQ